MARSEEAASESWQYPDRRSGPLHIVFVRVAHGVDFGSDAAEVPCSASEFAGVRSEEGEVMARYIDADALMRELGINDMRCDKCGWGQYGYCKRGGDFTDACLAIENAPTVDVVERKKGKWIDQYQDGDWHCSCCGAIVEKEEQTWRNWYFCYHCGADMRKEIEWT